MTAKRYRKLVSALATRAAAAGNLPQEETLGSILRQAKVATPDWTLFNSYQEAWDSLHPVREIYGMGEIGNRKN